MIDNLAFFRKGFGYRWHIIITVVLFFLMVSLNRIAGIFLISSEKMLILLLICLIYGLLPDIDTTESRIGKIFVSVTLVLILLSFLLDYAILGTVLVSILLFIIFVKHRGFVHTIMASIIFSAPLLLVGQEFFIFAIVSYIGHLLADGHMKIF